MRHSYAPFVINVAAEFTGVYQISPVNPTQLHIEYTANDGFGNAGYRVDAAGPGTYMVHIHDTVNAANDSDVPLYINYLP